MVDPKHPHHSREITPNPCAETPHKIIPIAALVLIWIVTRIVPALHCDFWTQWDIFQARKLCEYGFLSRAGALTSPPVMAGLLPFPSVFNYSNHPYGMVWIYTAVYAVGGAGLCLALALGIKLSSSLAGYFFLKRFFAPKAAWLASALAIIAPAAVIMDLESNIIGIAAAFWPFAALLVMAHREGRVRALWLGVVVFVGGQVDWMFLTLIPALIWLALPAIPRWRQIPAAVFEDPGARAISIGAILTSLLFTTQLLVYTPDLWTALNYVHMQTGSGSSESSRLRMAVAVVFRNVFFVGLALSLGVAVGLFTKTVNATIQRFIQATMIYFAGMCVVELALLRFCFVEPSPYIYMVFPAAIVTAHLLSTIRSRLLIGGLLASAIPFLGYVTIRCAVPRITEASSALAPAFARSTNSNELVLTNLRPNQAPFPSWDAAGPGMVSVVSDRLTVFDVSAIGKAQDCKRAVGGNFALTAFIYCPDQPISPDLLAAIKVGGDLVRREEITPRAQPFTLAARLRLAIWTLTGRYTQRAANDGDVPASVTLEAYRLREGWLGDHGK